MLNQLFYNSISVIFVAAFIGLFCYGCTGKGAHLKTNEKPYIELIDDKDDSYCDGSAAILLVFKQTYEGELISDARILVEDKIEGIVFNGEIGKYLEKGSLICIAEKYLSGTKIGLNYGYDHCAGSIYAFSLNSLDGLTERGRLDFNFFSLLQARKTPPGKVGECN